MKVLRTIVFLAVLMLGTGLHAQKNFPACGFRYQAACRSCRQEQGDKQLFARLKTSGEKKIYEIIT